MAKLLDLEAEFWNTPLEKNGEEESLFTEQADVRSVEKLREKLTNLFSEVAVELPDTEDAKNEINQTHEEKQQKQVEVEEAKVCYNKENEKDNQYNLTSLNLEFTAMKIPNHENIKEKISEKRQHRKVIKPKNIISKISEPLITLNSPLPVFLKQMKVENEYSEHIEMNLEDQIAKVLRRTQQVRLAKMFSCTFKIQKIYKCYKLRTEMNRRSIKRKKKKVKAESYIKCFLSKAKVFNKKRKLKRSENSYMKKEDLLSSNIRMFYRKLEKLEEKQMKLENIRMEKIMRIEVNKRKKDQTSMTYEDQIVVLQ